ncbi:MAG: hypothetical protein U0S50_05140 [Sphingopyxis sp.]|uniref:tetratricopeptide repeat protein n=1 Tax=Sphingopyxis sp. TaxID=1908224 RepID=UPI002AB8EDF8|nr:tetratricopeptide repeat protein [Sphingopyxis sp.]MDZ3831188.1 hypothetical protein [Sphingopyxis sp.]
MLEQAIGAGDLITARGVAARLWDSGDRRFDAQMVLLVDAMRRSDWKGARALVAARSDKTGGDAMARLLHPMFNAWIDVGLRESHAERHFDTGPGDAPRQPALALEAALVQLASKRPADAVASADAVVLSDRMSQLVALRLAATFDSVGEGDAARRLRGRVALAAGGRDDPMLLFPDRAISDPRSGVAHWLALLGDIFARSPNGGNGIALLFARSAHWLDDQDPAVRSALVEALAQGERRDAAIALLAEGRGPLLPVMAMRRAELLADAGELPAAARTAATAVKDDSAPRSLLLRFADLSRRTEDKALAEQAYARLDNALGSGADDVALRAMLLIARADLKLQANDWSAAEPLIERAVSLRPDDASVLNFAGYSALERRRDIDRSLARIEAAWKREPDNASITDSLGWAYFLTGRIAEAVGLLEKAQQGEPGNAVIVEHLGDAYWRAGRRFEARYTWRAAALIAEEGMAGRVDAKLRDGLTTATVAP